MPKPEASKGEGLRGIIFSHQHTWKCGSGTLPSPCQGECLNLGTPPVHVHTPQLAGLTEVLSYFPLKRDRFGVGGYHAEVSAMKWKKRGREEQHQRPGES